MKTPTKKSISLAVSASVFVALLALVVPAIHGVQIGGTVVDAIAWNGGVLLDATETPQGISYNHESEIARMGGRSISESIWTLRIGGWAYQLSVMRNAPSGWKRF